MWMEIGKNAFNLKDVSTVPFNEDDKQVVITMNNNRDIVINATVIKNSDALYDMIIDSIHAMKKRDDSREKNQTELIKSILSELKLISQNLRRF